MSYKLIIQFLLLTFSCHLLHSNTFLKEVEKSEISKTVLNSCENFISKNNLNNYKYVEINEKKFDTIKFSFDNLNNFKLIYMEKLTSKNFKGLTKVKYQIDGSKKEVIVYFFEKSQHSYFTFNSDDYTYNLNCIGNQHLLTMKKFEDSYCGNDSINSSDSELKEKIKSQLKLLSSYEECDIRLFIPYQDEVTDILNGKENVNELIKTSVDQLLDSYINSNISNTTFRIARTSEVEFNSYNSNNAEVAILNDLSTLKSLQIISNLRSMYYIDITSAIMEGLYWTDYFGSIYGMADAIYCNYNTSFCVTKYNKAVESGFFTFSHEIGHLQGCRHHNDGTFTPFTYGHGYNYQPGNWKTIMATHKASTTRILYWSNPDVTYGGVAMGTSGWEDNSRVIEETYDDMKDLKVTPTNYYMTDDDIVDEYDIADLVAFELLDVESEYINEPNSEVTFRAGNEIRIGPGFHSKSGSEFHAFIDIVDCSPSSKRVKEDQKFDSPFTGNTLLSISPNPVTSISNIKLTVGAADNVSLALYDNLGNKRLAYLENISLKSGTYNYKLDGNELNPGMFVLVLKIDGRIITEKVINLK